MTKGVVRGLYSKLKENRMKAELEMLCPKCKSEMKEFVTRHRCRNLKCRLEIKKYFQIKRA